MNLYNGEPTWHFPWIRYSFVLKRHIPWLVLAMTTFFFYGKFVFYKPTFGPKLLEIKTAFFIINGYC